MIPLPKPNPRGPKPKRRIAVRTVQKRSTAPRKKILPRCKYCGHPESKHDAGHLMHTCKRCEACPGYWPARGVRQKRRTPEAAVRRIADGLWTQIIHARPGGCEIQEYHPHTCVGGFQAMHGIPRTFSVTRHLPINGFKGCAGVHTFFSHRPEAWSALLLEAWGLSTFRELWADARSSRPVDMDATVAKLREELGKA